MNEKALPRDLDRILWDPLARRLYEEAALDLPIIDFHNHISVGQLRENRPFRDLDQLWLASDPYKHRGLRILGVPEERITGDVPGREKFRTWCRVFSKLEGNPLAHWSRMELEGILGIDVPLCSENADRIWDMATERLSMPEFKPQEILKKFPIHYQAPCAAFDDSLEPFRGLANVAPSLRGDNLLADPEGICRWLEAQWGESVTDLESLRVLLRRRLEEFHRLGCRFADHALDAGWNYVPDDGKNDWRFKALRRGEIPEPQDRAALQSHILRLLEELYNELGWVVQLHLGASRFTSTRLRELVGPAGGFAGIGTVNVESLIRLLDDLERKGHLPRTILYTMDNSLLPRLAILTGSFVRAGEPGYVQLGPAWWWCDHIRGMEDTLGAVMGYGLLSTFIGMTTDSRSLLSFSRHSYFRAVLCAWLAKQSRAGVITENFEDLTALVRAMCFENANSVLTERIR